MKINYTGEAFATLLGILNYIEGINTPGAGLRWLDKLERFLQNTLTHPSLIKLCNNHTFNELNLRCVNFNDWVIAFSLADDQILIEAILHSSRIVD
jgi:plasmid stabilization system protein ParE